MMILAWEIPDLAVQIIMLNLFCVVSPGQNIYKFSQCMKELSPMIDYFKSSCHN